MVNILASRFFLKESGENKMKFHEWWTTVPIGLIGIMEKVRQNLKTFI